MASSFQVIVAILIGLCSLLYFVYRSFLPKPIPGIPYDRVSVRRLLGDVPDILAWQKEHHEPFGCLVQKCKDLDSPIIQLFGRIGGKPWVVIADSREATDIMSRRSADFDRSPYFGDLFNAIMPCFQAQIPTNDEWRAHRRLLNDTMTPTFLYSTNGPAMHKAYTGLMELWRAKMKLASQHPIDVEKDIMYAALDGIWAAAFGEPAGALRTQVQSVAQVSKMEPDLDGIVRIPDAQIPLEVNAVNILADSTAIAAKSPLGGLHHKFATIFYPSLRAAMKAKESLLRRQINDAERRVRASSEDAIQSATDFVVARELKAAKKEGRRADIHSPVIHDELYGYLIAGHDTVATAIGWGLKFSMRNPNVQARLREAIYAAIPEQAGRDVPTANDIATASLPYLDAFIEEMMRLGPVTIAHVRVTIQDTQILGYLVPKGTDIFMPNTGQSMHLPSFKINDSVRSKTSVESKAKFGDFNEADMAEFKPERWLKEDGTFNPNAGPSLGFGVGLRACFGKKLALLELRIFFVLAAWNFEILPSDTEQGPLLQKQTLSLKPRNVHVRLRDLKQ